MPKKRTTLAVTVIVDAYHDSVVDQETISRRILQDACQTIILEDADLRIFGTYMSTARNLATVAISEEEFNDTLPKDKKEP